jgi:dTDP-4-dehydrorhamnose reductase
MKKERDTILITGCGGMLGQAFYEIFKEEYKVVATDIDVNEEWLTYLDVCDFQKYREKAIELKPKYIFHLAALTDLEYCELNPDESYRTNAMSVENVVSISKEVGATLLYISTAGIFGGEKDKFDDYDVPNPLSVYGRSKYMGERFVVENMDKYFVCRAGWMMGGGPRKDKKFINKIIKQIKEGAKELYVVGDKGGTPTYTFDFAYNVKVLIQSKHYGVYNMVCNGSCSRYDVAKEIINLLNLSDEIKLIEVDSEYFKKEYFVTRPVSEKLINRKLALRGLNTMGDWKESLAIYINKDFK